MRDNMRAEPENEGEEDDRAASDLWGTRSNQVSVDSARQYETERPHTECQEKGIKRLRGIDKIKCDCRSLLAEFAIVW